jgi:MoxR-like ATPase
MSKPSPPRSAPGAAKAEPASKLAVPIGRLVLEILAVVVRARRPLLLEGPTGIGKSQIVAEFARANDIGFKVLDLSLLEPPDLVGLPTIQGGRTHYASPAELPTEGDGILMLEELNRAEIPVMQPALQLLSARRLHAYELPPGWTCVAAVNPEDGDYHVNRLDPALRSRFLQVMVSADRKEWLVWAAREGIHPVVLETVRDNVDAFENVPPRSWAYASELLHAVRKEEQEKRDLVLALMRGYLPISWSILVTDSLAHAPKTITVDLTTLLSAEGPRALAAALKTLGDANRLDAVTMLASKLREELAGKPFVEEAKRGKRTRGELLAHLALALAPLPGDLREQCLEAAGRSLPAPPRENG